MLNKVKERLQGYKTYLVLASALVSVLLWVVGVYDQETLKQILAIHAPILGITWTAKIERKL